MPLKLDGTYGVSGIDGTASTPSLRGSDLTGNGIVYGTDTVQIATNGTTAVTVDSSQNVGIGTASPARKLHVSGGSTQVDYAYGVSGTSFRILNDATPSNGITLVSEYYGSGSYGPIKFNTGNAEAARIDSSGNLLVGTTSLLTGSPRLNIQSTGSYTATLIQNDNSDRTLMRLENKWATSSNNSTMIQFVDAAGTERGTIKTSTTATAYNTSSDYRLKENVQPMSGALTKVIQLNPVTFNWKINGSHGQGFIAHELQAIVPDCVTGEKDAVDAEGNPVYQGVDTSFLVATLTAAIQELSAKLDAATARIAALEAK